MRLEIVGTANTTQAKAGIEALTAQVEILNKAMARTTELSLGATPRSYAQTTAAVKSSTAAFQNALASTGAYEIQQVKINDATEKYTKLLSKQNLSMRQVFGRQNQAMMDQIYKRQLRIRNGYSQMLSGLPGDGTIKGTFAIPTEVPRSWDTLSNRVGFASERLRSAGNEMIKWGKNVQWSGRQLTVGLTMPLAAFGAGAAVMAYKVDQQLTRVQKVYNTTADQFSNNVHEQMAAQKELDDLREQGTKTAIDAARQYGVAMEDTLDVQADLAATGQKGIALQKATTEVVKNAMLGEIDYQTTTKATIAMQQQLHLSSQQLADTWAYMNNVENETSLTMKDFATAIPIALGPLRQMGGDVQTLGTLLTGLVARGVQVGKAANAIKATAQRLLRPSQQVQEEFKAITGADIVEIGKRNKGNLLGMLQDIYKVTKDLSQYNRAKAFAGLFGSFQLSTMSAMVDSMGDLAKGVGQVSTAQKIGQADAKQWGDVQRRELDSVTNSVSGKFRRAWQTVRAELAEMGDPFLNAASTMLKMIGALIHGFNQLPEPIKRAAMFGALLVAAFGPLRMLTGLIGNFTGSVLKGVGALGMWRTGWKSLTLEQKMEMDVAELAEKQMLSEADAAAILTKNIQALTYALQQQAIATAQASRGTVVLPQNTLAMMTEEQRLAYFRNQTPRQSGRFPTSQQRDEYAAQQMKNYNDEATKAAVATQKTEQSARRIGPGLKTAAASSGILAAGMTASMVSSDHMVQELANAAMILGSIGMIMPGMVGGFKRIMSEIQITRAGAAGMAEEGMQAAAGLTAGRTALAAMGGPIGIALAGVTAIGIGAYVWQKHEEKITEERRKQNAALYEQNGLLNKALGLEQQRHRALTFVPESNLKNNMTPAYNIGGLIAESVHAYKSDDTGKALVEGYKNASSAADRLAISQQVYLDALRRSGGDALKAKIALTALYRAAGEGADEADSKTLQLAADLKDMGRYAQDQLNFKSLFDKAITTNADDAASQGEKLGKMLMDSAVRSIRHGNKDVFKSINDEITKQWQNTLTGFQGTTTGDTLNALGINNADAAQNFVSDMLVNPGGLTQEQIQKKWKITGTTMNNTFDAASRAAADLNGVLGNTQKTTKAIIDYFRNNGLEGLPKGINSLSELANSWQYQLSTVNPKNANDLYKRRLGMLREERAGLMGVEAIHVGISDEQKKQLRNEIDQQLAQNGYNKKLDDSKNKAGQVADEIRKIPSRKTIVVAITQQQLGGVFQTAMQGVQQDLADRATNQLDAQATAAMNAAQAAGQRRMDALEAAGQRRQDALERRQQNEQDRFDKHWQHREDVINHYYDVAEAKIDKEIKAEQRAEQIRQRIFEAEQARLDHMTDMANRTIDFNVAIGQGQLDEAAKIMNDMNASETQFAMDQGNQQQQDASQRRQDRLNKQKDRLEKERKVRLKNLQKQEDDARKHLERVQAMESAALQKSIDAQQKALQTQIDNQQTALQAEWDARKQNLADQLSLFTSYIASSKGELQRWMREVGLSYKDFGINTLQPMSDTWGKFFQDAFLQHLRVAGAQVASDNMWTRLGKSGMNQILAGMGFPTMAGFKRFIQTGNLPENFGKPPKHKPGDHTSGLNTPHNHMGRPGDDDIPSIHTGGVFGYDNPGRGGYSGPLRSDEGYALLKHGEMVMNPAATQKYMPILRQWNSEGIGIGGSMPPGAIGLLMPTAAKLFQAGFKTALGNIVDSVKKKHKGGGKVSGGFIEGPGGHHRPVPAGIGLVRGIHDSNTGFPAIDIATPLNTSAFAVADGTITRSQAITSGGSPGNGLYSIPYRSYGNVIQLKTDGGPEVLYAHLNKRMATAGMRVKGGARIGLTGNTGNSTGPHLHFGSSDGNPMEWMRTGGDIMRDGLYRGHSGETVLTKPLSRDLKLAVKAFSEVAADRQLRTNLANLGARDRVGAALRGAEPVASGDCYHYDIPISVLRPGASDDEIADTVIRRLKHEEGRIPTRRTNREDH